jgi:hypothetical protein
LGTYIVVMLKCVRETVLVGAIATTLDGDLSVKRRKYAQFLTWRLLTRGERERKSGTGCFGST